jgi:hypothetical protein
MGEDMLPTLTLPLLERPRQGIQNPTVPWSTSMQASWMGQLRTTNLSRGHGRGLLKYACVIELQLNF